MVRTVGRMMAQPCLLLSGPPGDLVRGRSPGWQKHEGQGQQLVQKAKDSCFGKTEAGRMHTGVSKEKLLSHTLAHSFTYPQNIYLYKHLQNNSAQAPKILMNWCCQLEGMIKKQFCKGILFK